MRNRLWVPEATVRAMDAARRVIAVGDDERARDRESGGKRAETNLFISPGFEFKEPARC